MPENLAEIKLFYLLNYTALRQSRDLNPDLLTCLMPKPIHSIADSYALSFSIACALLVALCFYYTMELQDGIEPPACTLQEYCSAN